jgi:hypothetical protein
MPAASEAGEIASRAAAAQADGEAPPPHAKENFDVSPVAAWWSELPAADRMVAQRLLGAALDFGLALPST